MIKTVVYLAAIVFSAHCFNKNNERQKRGIALSANISINRIGVAGGTNANIGQYPWVARLESSFDGINIYRCDGSLISDRFVLTAAHCVEKTFNFFAIFLGDYDTTTFPIDCVGSYCTENKIFYPERILKHEYFDYIINDVALLRLSERVEFSASIQPISLPPFDIDIEDNLFKPLTVIGWGRTRTTRRPTILQTAEIHLIPKRVCEEISDLEPPLGHMCAGDSTYKNSCKGDSGGPLLMYNNDQYYVAGIVSYGSNASCGNELVSAYVNVFKYKDWIERNMVA